MTRTPRIPEEITPTTPLRLNVAAEIAFPAGGVTAASLRREAARGRLVIERIAGKDFVTLQAIEDMRARCRVPPKEPAFTSDSRPPTGRPGGTPTGPSEMDRVSLARAALHRIARERSKRSKPT